MERLLNRSLFALIRGLAVDDVGAEPDDPALAFERDQQRPELPAQSPDADSSVAGSGCVAPCSPRAPR